jgi:Helicase associated domain
MSSESTQDGITGAIPAAVEAIADGPDPLAKGGREEDDAVHRTEATDDEDDKKPSAVTSPVPQTGTEKGNDNPTTPVEADKKRSAVTSPVPQTGTEKGNDNPTTPVHKATSSRTAEALREFKRKMGLCEIEGCENKRAAKMEDGMEVCHHHFANGINSPPKPVQRGRKRKSEAIVAEVWDDASSRAPGSPAPSSNADDASSGVARNTCLVKGCEKLRAKGGFCTRHFKDRSAPIRSVPSDYERRYCMKEGCDKLRSKGFYCHRHNQDITAPIKGKGASTTHDRKKLCSIEGCDRLQVKGGYCSRHAKNPNAVVKDTPAFSFDADARWDELFPKLEAFAKENGHARYPTSKKTDMSKFVTQIRSVYRQKKNKSMKGNPNADPDTVEPDLSSSKLLTPERMEALQSIGFEFQLWTVEPGQWEQRFQGKSQLHRFLSHLALWTRWHSLAVLFWFPTPRAPRVQTKAR